MVAILFAAVREMNIPILLQGIQQDLLMNGRYTWLKLIVWGILYGKVYTLLKV